MRLSELDLQPREPHCYFKCCYIPAPSNCVIYVECRQEHKANGPAHQRIARENPWGIILLPYGADRHTGPFLYKTRELDALTAQSVLYALLDDPLKFIGAPDHVPSS